MLNVGLVIAGQFFGSLGQRGVMLHTGSGSISDGDNLSQARLIYLKQICRRQSCRLPHETRRLAAFDFPDVVRNRGRRVHPRAFRELRSVNSPAPAVRILRR
jgi:hypothetical protein